MRSIERQQTMFAALEKPAMTLEGLADKFLPAPLYSRRADSPTVYSAVYLPAERRANYRCPGKRWIQPFDQLVTADYTHD
jgi:predicted choloylglycine hydrolase